MEKRMIEINGVKMEVDMRTATTVDSLKVGDPVKVLVKSYSDYKSFAGVIIGFDEFKERPTIIVMYLKTDYSSCTLEYAYINKDSKDVEVIKARDPVVPFEKTAVNDRMDQEIEKKERELADLRYKKKYFNESFAHYFQGFEAEVTVE